MSKLEIIPAITVIFTGDNAEQVLADHPDVARAVWDACRGAYHANIKVHVMPRINDMTPLEWSMSVASPKGRTTMTVVQQSPAGAVRFISN